MIKYQDNITARLNGGALQPVAGATISVSTRAGAPAVIYADDGVTIKPQPLVTDNNGHFEFRALNGEYVLTISAAQFATFTREIELLDVDDVNEAMTSLANVQQTTHDALALVDAELVAIAGSGGAAKVGYGTDTVAGSLDALQMADYTALRAYSGARKNVYVTDLATAGMFVRDDADTAVLGTPVNAAFSTAITGGTLAAGTYSYRVSAIDAYGETLASTETSIAAAKLAAPAANAPTTATTGGTLAAATYYYKVTALGAAGETIGSNEVSIATTGTTSTVTITWGAVTGATGYRVYRGTAAGGQNAYYAPGNVTTFTDTGAASTAGSVPTANTATTNTNTVTVNWGAVTGATGYKVYGRTAGAQLFMATLGAVTTWTDTGSITPAGALPTGYKKDNGSTVIQSANGKRWKRDGFTQSGTGAVLRTMQDKAREVVSVKDFGAKGDGVTDDTAAIQAALNAAACVLVPLGTYRVASTVTIPADKKLVGAGGIEPTAFGSAAVGDRGTVKLIADQSAFTGTATVAMGTRTALEGITVYGSATVECVKVGNNAQLRSVRAVRGKYGLNVTSVGGISLIDVQTDACSYGMFSSSGGTDIKAIDCVFANSANDGVLLNAGAGQIAFTNTRFEWNGKAPLTLYDVVGGVVVDATCAMDRNGEPVRLQGTTSNVSLLGRMSRNAVSTTVPALKVHVSVEGSGSNFHFDPAHFVASTLNDDGSGGNFPDYTFSVSGTATGINLLTPPRPQNLGVYFDAATSAAMSRNFLIQQKEATLSTAATGTATFVAGDGVPQNTHGTEFLTVSITPRRVGNTLLVEAETMASHSVASHIIAAIFKDSDAAALAVAVQYQSTATGLVNLKVSHRITTASAAPTVFKLRIGATDGGTTTVNGTSTFRYFGGTAKTTLRVTELA